MIVFNMNKGVTKRLWYYINFGITDVLWLELF